MANSIVTHTGDGVTIQYAINFTLGILSRDHVTCQVNNEEDGLGDPIYRDLEWITNGLVNIQGDVPEDGVPIVFLRTVPKDVLYHDYSNGAVIEESNLDDSNKQALMAIHEFLDGRIGTGGFTQDLSMNGAKITNLGDGEDPGDAVNFQQLEDATGNAPAFAAAAAASAAASAASAVAADNSAAAAESWAIGEIGDRPEGSAKYWAELIAGTLNNLVATTNPTVNDDSGDGYAVGSKWYNVTADEAYECLDATVGAALWVKTTLTVDELGTMAFEAAADYQLKAGSIQTVADTATLTPLTTNDLVEVTALAQAMTVAAPSGTPVNGQILIIEIKDNGTARALTWNGVYLPQEFALPTTTVLGKILTVAFKYRSANTSWYAVGGCQEQ